MLRNWLEANIEEHPDGCVPVESVWQRYTSDCAERGRPTRSKIALGRALSAAGLKYIKGQEKIDGKQTWCYFGLRLTREKGSAGRLGNGINEINGIVPPSSYPTSSPPEPQEPKSKDLEEIP